MMETLQWTLLVGLLGMVVYVLWSRLKASYAVGVAPRVNADWEGDAVALREGVLDVSIRVKTEGAVHCELQGPTGEIVVIHEGPISSGVHTWSVKRPLNGGQWKAKLRCEGHHTERRFTL